jgi:hypothetical protein
MNSQLRNLYDRHLPALLTLRKQYPMTSYPHLIRVAPAYEKARRKVAFVGQQTAGWAPHTVRAAEMEADLPNRLIDGLLKLYEEFFPPGPVSPFWRAAQQVYNALVPKGPTDGYVWVNLVKIDENKQGPPVAADQDWFERFNVLPDELAILKPDVLIFFTGPYYDERMLETFPGAKLIPILETDSMIARVEHPALPPHTYRTYHPGFLNRGRWHVIEQLITLCQEQSDPRTIRPSEVRLVQTRAKGALAGSLQDLVGHAAMDPNLPGYVKHLESNLLPTVKPVMYVEYRNAAGHELQQKMRAAYSSSALTVNTFAPWKGQTGQLSLGIRAGFEGIRFEAICRTGLQGTAPHLDLLVQGAEGPVGVEVKCTEYLEMHEKEFSQAYDEPLGLYPELERLRNEWGFTFLNASQLVKHALGLLNEAKGGSVTLLYLFWEPVNWQDYRIFAEHRRQVRRFATFLEGSEKIRFAAMTFDQLWTAWALQPGPDWLPAHIEALRARYSVSL